MAGDRGTAVRNPQLASAIGRLLDGVARLSLVLACLSLTLLVLLFAAVILARLLGIAVPSADDIAGILLGGTLALGFAAAVPQGQHISVDYVVDAIGGAGAAALRVLSQLVTIGIVGYLLTGFSRMWYAAYLSGITMLGTLPIPRAAPMGIVLAGVALLELALVLRFLQCMLGAGFRSGNRELPEGTP